MRRGGIRSRSPWPRLPSRGRGARGFTLLEVLFALVVLALGLLGLAALSVTVIRGNAGSDRMATATILAQDKLEELRNLPYDDPQLSDDEDDDDLEDPEGPDHTNADGPEGIANPINSLGQHLPGGGFTRIWNIGDDTPAEGTKTIAVLVLWDEQGRSRRVVFSTIKGQYQ